MAVGKYPEWQTGPEAFQLPLTAVHIWCASLRQSDAVRAALWETLADDERSRALRYRRESVQQDWIVSRGVVRSLLGRYLGCEPGTLEFAYEPYGKPRLSGPSVPPLAFNVTHSHDLLLCAIAWDCWLGIDVEHQRSISQLSGIIERYFAPSEQAVLTPLPPEAQKAAFLQYWTLKEAVCKATGQGIQALTSTVIHLEAIAAKVVSLGDSPPTEAWQLQSFVPQPEYVGAIAYTAAPRPIHYWSWQPEAGS